MDAVCTPVCTLLDEQTLEGVIAAVTRALAATDDPELVARLADERRALREELTLRHSEKSQAKKVHFLMARRGAPR